MLPANTLAWDADSKDFDAKPGEQMARFTFYVTNISAEVVVITNLQRSCGCTDASMPAQPWSLTPGAHGPVQASIDLRGKAGKISKSLTVQTLIGWKTLTLNVNIPPPPGQAVFKGDCAKCHVEPTIGKMGHELYVAGCGICHDAEHLKQWITASKPGSLMPAFSKAHDGPLNDEQIASLVNYLTSSIPSGS
jgi:cytochrome c2